MVRLAIIDKDEKVLSLQDLALAAELRAVAEQARNLTRECDRLARLKDAQDPSIKKAGTPYLS